MVLIDLVEQRSIADVQQSGSRLTIPPGFGERRCNRVSFSFGLDVPNQVLERPWCVPCCPWSAPSRCAAVGTMIGESCIAFRPFRGLVPGSFKARSLAPTIR